MSETSAPSDIEQWLSGFVRDPAFIAAYPHYAAILAKLTPVADPSVQRMAVSLHGGRFYLHVNVDSFLAEPHYLRGVLLHEVHHVVLGHLTHPKFADVEEPHLMDLAVEMSANEYIVEPLPNPITWQSYAQIGITAGQSTLDRYDLLVRLVRATGALPRPTPAGGDARRVDDHRFLARGAVVPGGVEQTALLISRAAQDAREERVRRDRAEAEGGEAVDLAEEDDARRHLVAGRAPGRLIEELSDTSMAPEEAIDWRAALPMFVARSRAPVHTWSKPSRRFPHRIFEVPGRTWAPRRTENPRLLVAIDTSMSMTRTELEEIARHLTGLSEHAQLTIVECDVEIARIYPFSGRIDDVSGRGGTDLRPVFSPAILGAHDIDGVVYFTDGLGPPPVEPPPIPVLWVLTKPQTFQCPWGERARMPRADRAFSRPASPLLIAPPRSRRPTRLRP